MCIEKNHPRFKTGNGSVSRSEMNLKVEPGSGAEKITSDPQHWLGGQQDGAWIFLYISSLDVLKGRW